MILLQKPRKDGKNEELVPSIDQTGSELCVSQITEAAIDFMMKDPWEHPYETVKHFADKAAERQTECPTPAKVRTWIQGYNAYKEPHVEYHAENVGKEIQALYDAGLTDGWMVWNGSSNIDSCREQADAFKTEP